MSLTKEAIQLITDTALQATGKSLETSQATVVLPENSTIVSLEKWQAGRSRFRGIYSTHSLADFVAYTAGRAIPTAKGFIDQDAMSCTIIFNLGDDENPGHADDRALLSLRASAGYKAAQSIGGRQMTQKELSDWIEDWHQFVTAVDESGNHMNLSRAIAAVRTITVKAASESAHTVSDTGASRSAMDQIEASSKETLPASLVFSVVPYEGLTEQQISLRLSVITSGTQPGLKLRWVGEEVQREGIAQEFKSVLQAQVGESAALVLGAFDPKA